MNCVFIGGVAAGAVLDIRPDAAEIELKSRDVFIKPLDSVRDIQESDKEFEHDKYDIHPIQMVDFDGPTDPEGKAFTFSIGVRKGQTLSWAVQELITAYCDKIEAAIKANANT